MLQAVNGVVLGIVAAEAIPQTPQGLPHQLQVVGLPKKPRGLKKEQGKQASFLSEALSPLLPDKWLVKPKVLCVSCYEALRY